jgi:hypothetical protein
MPHYADGSEAKVGDQVTGVLYNSGPAPKAGTIISITPGVESCNAMVQYTEALPIADEGAPVMPEPPRNALFGAGGPTRSVKGEQHGSSGQKFVLFTCTDYTETKQLTKVG